MSSRWAARRRSDVGYWRVSWRVSDVGPTLVSDIGPTSVVDLGPTSEKHAGSMSSRWVARRRSDVGFWCVSWRVTDIEPTSWILVGPTSVIDVNPMSPIPLGLTSVRQCCTISYRVPLSLYWFHYVLGKWLSSRYEDIFWKVDLQNVRSTELGLFPSLLCHYYFWSM